MKKIERKNTASDNSDIRKLLIFFFVKAHASNLSKIFIREKLYVDF